MTLITLRLSNTGRQVAYQDQGSGEALVLIHGVGMQSAAWASQISAFSKTHRVIALDMPGHGGSDPLPMGSTLPDFVRWCADALEQLELGAVNLVGHSMGALIASGYAATRPDDVRRVALLNGVFRRDAAARTAVMARAAEIKAGRVDFETPLNRWFGATDHDRKARAQVAEWLSAVDMAGYATAYAAFAQGDAAYADRFADITCPLLALTGDDDPNSTPEMAQAMADAAPNGRFVVLKGHRHMANLTAAEAVNGHLSDWLKQPVPVEVLQ